VFDVSCGRPLNVVTLCVPLSDTHSLYAAVSTSVKGDASPESWTDETEVAVTAPVEDLHLVGIG
jgi:hypothetical protein